MNQQNITRSFLILSLILLFIGTSGCGKKKDNKGVMNSSSPMGVNVIVIQPRELENVIFSNGTILANEAVELRSEVSGRIRNISFTEVCSSIWRILVHSKGKSRTFLE